MPEAIFGRLIWSHRTLLQTADIARRLKCAATSFIERRKKGVDTVERAMEKIQEGRYVLIPYSDKTHGHFTHYYAAVWKPYLISFMETLRPSAAAVAPKNR